MNISEKKICIIQSSWHKEIVNEITTAFIECFEQKGGKKENLDIFEVPGALEIPLLAKIKAKTGKYHAIMVAGLIVDGGIYRHEFVAQAVINGCMSVQLETEVPIIHSVMTPIHFHESKEHHDFFFAHFKEKGKEAFNALEKTLENL